MPERTVKIKGYTAKREGRRSRLALRGEVVEVSEADAELGDSLGYFEPVGGSEVVDETVESAAIVDMSDDEIDEWIDEGATVREVVGAAADAEDANRILAAEHRVATANDRDARVGIEKGLAAILGASE